VYLRETAKDPTQARIVLGKLQERAQAGKKPEAGATVSQPLDLYMSLAEWDVSIREGFLDIFYARLKKRGDLTCGGKPFTEHHNVPDLRPSTEGGGLDWEQAAVKLRAAIESGSLPAGSDLPSVRDLQNWQGIRRMTLQWTLCQLADEGLVSAATTPAGGLPTRCAGRPGDRTAPALAVCCPDAAAGRVCGCEGSAGTAACCTVGVGCPRGRGWLDCLHGRAATLAGAWRRDGMAAVRVGLVMAVQPGVPRRESLAEDVRRIAEEQAGLRRVATLVARAASPEEVFAAVAAEAGRVLAADLAWMTRYEADGALRVVAAWSDTGAVPVPVGTRVGPGGWNVSALMFRTGRAARVDDYAGASGPAAETARESGLRASVGVPVSVEGRPWGVVAVGSRVAPLPTDTEERLASFTELAATAIACAQARTELRGFAEEQAALRRVATLVAHGAPSEEVFDAVAVEAGRVLPVAITVLARYDPGSATVVTVGTWSGTGAVPAPVGTRTNLGGRNASTLVFETGRPARIDDYADFSGPLGNVARGVDLQAAVGVPVRVGGRLWGVMIAASAREPLPADTEERLANFTELAGTALANAEAQAALVDSRARIVAAADAARRRIERNLHDGAQQRLVSLALQLRAAQAALPPGAAEAVQQVDDVVAGLADALEELREIARGLHPAILTEEGLRPALEALARQAAVPVRLNVQVAERLPDPAEVAAYYAVAEALTNTAKHARASAAKVEVTVGEGMLRVSVRDDGRGGAAFGRSSGLVGLKDRVEALGGRLSLDSPLGAGTFLDIVLPLGDLGGPGRSAGAAGPPREG
jgi:signal transduction histidine kinase